MQSSTPILDMASHWSSDYELNCEVKHYQFSFAKKMCNKEKGEDILLNIYSFCSQHFDY